MRRRGARGTAGKRTALSREAARAGEVGLAQRRSGAKDAPRRFAAQWLPAEGGRQAGGQPLENSA